MALIVDDYEDTWSRPTAVHAGQIADGILADGFRRVAEDEATVERVAEKLWREFWREVPGYGITKDFWRGPARAAVRALREADE